MRTCDREMKDVSAKCPKLKNIFTIEDIFEKGNMSTRCPRSVSPRCGQERFHDRSLCAAYFHSLYSEGPISTS